MILSSVLGFETKIKANDPLPNFPIQKEMRKAVRFASVQESR
jgi:hypothetical protein